MRARIDGMLSDKLRLGIALSLVASILMLVVWVRLISQPFSMAVETEFRGLWTLSSVIRFGFVIGWTVLILIGALVLYIKPKQHSLAATIILAFSTLTLLFWAGGYIFRGLERFYWPPWTFLWRVVNLYDGRLFKFIPFDVLAIASVLGVAGAVLGFLWKPKSAVVPAKQSGAKPNLLGVLSAIMAFGSLALPWWVDTNVSFGPFIFPWGQDPSGMPGWWFDIAIRSYDTVMYAALAFILVSGILGLRGSLEVGKKGRFLLFVAGVSALLSVATFAMALQSTLTGYNQTIFLVSKKTVGTVYYGYSYLSFGFWVALAAAISAFIASLRHPPTPSETPPS